MILYYEDITREIIDYLPGTTKISFGTCNKESMKLFRSTVTKLKPINIDDHNEDELDRLAVAFPNINSLILNTDTPHIYFPNWRIRNLIINNTTFINIDQITQYNDTLKTLLIRSEIHRIQPISQLTRLTHLDICISSGTHIGMQEFHGINTLKIRGYVLLRPRYRLENLINLDLDSNIIEYELDMPNLKTLSCLSFIPNLTLPSLKILRVTFGDELRNFNAINLETMVINVLPGNRSYFYRFPKLKKLWIQSTTIPLSTLAADLRMLNLTSLTVSLPINNAVSQEGMQEIITLPKLQNLALFPTAFRYLFSLEFWRPTIFSRIIQLNLSNTNIPDSVLINMNVITKLIIPGSMNITDYGITTLISQRGRELRKINVQDCHGITEISRNMIQENCEEYRL
jgi:hypothetical protein